MSLPTVPDLLPVLDGDVNLYNYGHPPTNRQFLFVNGIDTSPRAHRQVGRKLSVLTGANVYGVYNRTTGKPNDLTQCVLDWACIEADSVTEDSTDVVRGLTNHNPFLRIPMPLTQVARAMDLTMADAIDMVITSTHVRLNACTQKLCKLLIEEVDRWHSGTLVIVAHSQGNLITSAALYAYFACLRLVGRTPRRRIKVFGLASPAQYWPENRFLGVRLYTNRDDFVTWISLGASYGGQATVELSGNNDSNPISRHLAMEYVHKPSFLTDLQKAL
jgi:hypothetical protein